MKNFLSYRRTRLGEMIKMKFGQLRRMLPDHLGFPMIVFTVVVLLVLSVISPSFTALADEEEEVPEWKKGYRWRYKETVPMPDMEDMENEFEMEVVGESKVNIPVEGGDDISDDTYVVDETLNPGEDNETDIRFHYRKDDLAELYNEPEPEDDVSSGFAPAIVRLDFPLQVGENWTGDAKRYLHPEEDADLEKSFAYSGTVENRTSVKSGMGEFEDTYMVNLEVWQYKEEGGEKVLEAVRRFEVYYSPEVKNVVHQDSYETKEVPDDHTGPGSGQDYEEEWIGNETLLEYSLKAEEENGDGDEEDASLMGVGVVLLIIGVGTASIYVYKKVKNSL